MGGTDNGRQKTRNHGYDVIVGGELLPRYRSPSQTCHAKPKTQINRRRTLQTAFPVGGMPTTGSLAWRLYRKVRTLWHCSRLRSVALYPCWSWWYASGNRPLQQYLGFTAGRWLWSVPSIRLTAWLQNSKKRAERSERLMYEQSHRDYLRSSYSCIIVCLSWAAGNYRDNMHVTCKTRDKMPENWSWRTRQLLTCRCVSVMLLRSMQNTRRS